MLLFAKNPNEQGYVGGEKHFVDVIKNRGASDSLIYLNPEEDFNDGSTLIVGPGEAAIFVDGGSVAEVFTDGTHTLSTANYPFISRLRNSLSGGISSFNCKVYFVRTASSREILWGTDSPIKVYDRVLVDPVTGIGVETDVRARGSYRVNVEDPALFLTELVGNNYEGIEQEDLNHFFRTQFQSLVVQNVARWLGNMAEPLLAASAHLTEIASGAESGIVDEFSKFGLRLRNFSISAIDIVENEQRRRLQADAVARQSEVFGARAEALRYQTLGTTFQEASQLDIARTAAANEGGIAGTLMGAGMGLTMGSAIGGAAGREVSNAFSENSQAPHQFASSVEDVKTRLETLSSLHSEGLLTDEEFAEKRAKILESL